MKIPDTVRRSLYILAAFSLSLVGVFSEALGHASANQITTRSITMSNSSITGTNVEYKAGFVVTTTGNIGGVVIDFCSNDPIIGDTCTAPTGFNTNKATTTVSGQTGAGLGTLAVDTTNSTANKLILTTTAASVSATTAVTISIGDGTTNGFTNPTSAAGSFYARIYTYATTAAAQGHNTNSPSGYVDYGGIALSTAAVINITAKVQETLSFCVYKTTCGDDPSFTIGHTVGTATVIDSSVIDTSDTNFSIATNANGGAAIRMKGDTLKSGANDIDAAGVSNTFVAGTENFGVRVSATGTNITATSPYNGAAGVYSLVVTGGGTNDITSTFGGQVAALSAPVNSSVSTIRFAATASNTTPAGTYTAAEQLIATGTF